MTFISDFEVSSLFALTCSSFPRKELTADARELKGELYCLPCHDKMGVPICGACRRPIEGRVVNAMGKQWHVEVCCQEMRKPILSCHSSFFYVFTFCNFSLFSLIHPTLDEKKNNIFFPPTSSVTFQLILLFVFTPTESCGGQVGPFIFFIPVTN